MKRMDLRTLDLTQNAFRILSTLNTRIKLTSVEEYNYLFKNGGNKADYNFTLSKHRGINDFGEILNKVRAFLLSKHPSVLRKALGSPVHKAELKKIISEYVSNNDVIKVKGLSLEELTTQLLNAIAGLGVIDTILANNKEDITDLRFNGRDLWIYSNKRLPYKSELKLSEQDAADLAMKIAFATGKDFSSTNIEMDTEISNLRVNGVNSAVSSGTSLAFRTMTKGVRITEENFVQTLGNQVMLDFLIACVKSKTSIAIIGETGTGKTEMIKFLTKFTLPHHPINVIEDTPETFMQDLYPEKDICLWFTKKSSTGEIEVNISRLLRSSLRNNPSWIIITEARGGEMIAILKAAGTGHAVITSFHTESTQTSGNRIVLMSKEDSALDEKLIQRLIPDAFKVVLQISYNQVTQERKITGIGEYTHFDVTKNEVNTNDIFGYTLDGANFEDDGTGQMVLKTKHSFKQLSTISDSLAEKFISSGVLTTSLVPLLSDEIKQKYNISLPSIIGKTDELKNNETPGAEPLINVRVEPKQDDFFSNISAK